MDDPRLIPRAVLFIGSGALIYLVSMIWVGWAQTLGALLALGWPTLIIGGLLASTAYLWRFGRWEYALNCLGCSVHRLRHLGIYLAGLALTATPGKAGETFRSVLLKQYGVRVSYSLATFLADRASDVLGMCLLGTIASWLAGQPHAWGWGLVYFSLCLASSFFAYLLLHPRTDNWWIWLNRYLKWLPVKGSQETLECWARLWQLPRVLGFSMVAMLAYGTQALVFAWFCKVAGVALAVADCVQIFVQATLFGAASMAPGGLVAMEGALVFLLVQHGVGESEAVSLAIAIRLVTLWTGIGVGMVAMFFSMNKKVESVSQI